MFQCDLMGNVLALHRDLQKATYKHGGYHAFKIADPKPRDIHKASVRDRLVHHALHRKLDPFVDRIFISDSYSCRKGKGTHRAMNRFRALADKVSRNDTRTAWVLKCDIRKFFASVDHVLLLKVVDRLVGDRRTVDLIGSVVASFHSSPGKGLPLGNLTSQLLVNVYMNELDQFVKHTLKAKYYIRYADDFVILSDDKTSLERLIPCIAEFLWTRLRLKLHPRKVSIRTVASGVDFLGWVHFADHRVLRTTTKRRMLRQLGQSKDYKATTASYLGLLRHGNAAGLAMEIKRRMPHSCPGLVEERVGG